MKMLIISNKGNNYIPPIQNTLNDKHFDDIVYDDSDKCELLNKYFTLISKLKASGPDRISHKMLKISPEKITKPLKIIFNKSLAQGKYPSTWKNYS
jgi:hypothetical protein